MTSVQVKPTMEATCTLCITRYGVPIFTIRNIYNACDLAIKFFLPHILSINYPPFALFTLSTFYCATDI